MNSKVSCLLLLLLTIILATSVFAAEPFGANTTFINSSRTGAYVADQENALAGNVTELDVFGYTTTNSWQGYFGNVTGTIQLADIDSNVMYNWSVASPRGQVYTSTNGSGIQWQYIQCFNYTAAGTFGDDKARAGNTNYLGRNLTQLQSDFGLQSRDDDAVNNTFRYIGGQGHRLFYVNSLDFTTGECETARIFGPDGSQTQTQFEEVLLYEPESRSTVFTSLLNEDLSGFDNRAHDFEMLVLEDGHGTNIATTPYYFYLELY